MEEKEAAAAAEKAAIVAQDTQVAKEEEKPVVKDNVVFKVQIGSFQNGKITPAFKTLYSKLSKLHKIDDFMDAKKFKIFTIGNTTNYEVASKLKDQIKLEGVKGAFVVAYNNGRENSRGDSSKNQTCQINVYEYRIHRLIVRFFIP